MQAFTYDNVTVEFESASGWVVSCKRLKEPRKSVEGEYWIRTADGRELAVQTRDPDIALRIGHEVSLIIASSAMSEQSFIALVRNHNVAQSCVISNAESLHEALVGPLSRGKPLLVSLLTSAATAWLIGAWGLTSGWLLYHVLRTEQLKRQTRLIEGLGAHIANLDRRIVSNRAVDRALTRSLVD